LKPGQLKVGGPVFKLRPGGAFPLRGKKREFPSQGEKERGDPPGERTGGTRGQGTFRCLAGALHGQGPAVPGNPLFAKPSEHSNSLPQFCLRWRSTANRPLRHVSLCGVSPHSVFADRRKSLANLLIQWNRFSTFSIRFPGGPFRRWKLDGQFTPSRSVGREPRCGPFPFQGDGHFP